MHELIVVDLDPAIAIGIKPTKGLAELFDDDARTHEAIERDSGGGDATASGLVGFNVYPEGQLLLVKRFIA